MTEKKNKVGTTTATYHESFLLVDGLELAVTKFGRCIDKLEVDLFQRSTLGLHQQRLLGKDEMIRIKLSKNKAAAEEEIKDSALSFIKSLNFIQCIRLYD